MPRRAIGCMKDITDTIAAISSGPVTGGRVLRTVIRISGPQAMEIVHDLIGWTFTGSGIEWAYIKVNGVLCETAVYHFPSGQSYTGDELIELHVLAAECIIKAIMHRIYRKARPAEPGEFTMRAYLNGKMDISSAEAVAEIISGSNEYQVQAAQKLLDGRLAENISEIRKQLVELISLVEAGLDFSEENIEFISREQAMERAQRIAHTLREISAGQVRCERAIDLPCVGLCGAVNAGKSTLTNALLGTKRSIVSNLKATTRDVLRGELDLPSGRCVLFDCAGLSIEPADSVDELSQSAASQALASADLAVFCVDAAKKDLSEDLAVYKKISCSSIAAAALKTDLVKTGLDQRLDEMKKSFGIEFMPVSFKKPDSVNNLKQAISGRLNAIKTPSAQSGERIALTQRHDRIVTEAIRSITDAVEQLKAGADEIAAMLLQEVHKSLGGIEHEDISEKVLENIFSKFCIGK